MELTVKHKGGTYVVCDEAGRHVAEVQKLYLKNGQMKVVDQDGNVCCLAGRSGDRINIVRNAGNTGNQNMTGQIYYEEDGDGNTIQQSLFRPPMAEALRMESPWGEIRIVQDRKREFDIFLQEKKIGEMSHMMSLQKKIRVISEELPGDVYGLLFGLGMYMLRDDDVEIV